MQAIRRNKKQVRPSDSQDGDKFVSAWKGLVYEIASSDTLIISGVRKIVANVSWEISLADLYDCQITFEDLYYTQAKFRQLARNYWDVESIKAATDKVSSRADKPHTSVAFQLKNGEKDSRSQGYCMQNMVLTRTPNGSSIDIYYRSTEVLQKFLADLIFFKQMFPAMLKDAGIEPTTVRFKFANVYLSAVFMPILFRYDDTPEAFFKALAVDAKFNRTCCSATAKFFQETHNYTYRTRVKMFEYAKEHLTPEKYKLLADTLKDYRNDTVIEEDEDVED